MIKISDYEVARKMFEKEDIIDRLIGNDIKEDII